jgi:hypothetical protein
MGHMTREEMIRGLAQAGTVELKSGKIVEVDEDLGAYVAGLLFDDYCDLYMDVYNEKTEMTIRMEFCTDGVRLSAPQLADREYRPGVLPYTDLTDTELAALYNLAQEK